MPVLQPFAMVGGCPAWDRSCLGYIERCKQRWREIGMSSLLYQISLSNYDGVEGA